jgi:hypothetical protein
MSGKTYAGGCFCGAVRYTLTGEPAGVICCHCATCRHIAGAPYITAMGYDASNVEWSGIEPAGFRASDHAERRFCPRCGGNVSFHYDPPKTRVAIWLTTLDDPTVFTPTAHIWTASKLPWVSIPADVPSWKHGMHG